MSILEEINKMKKAIKHMNNDLSKKPDDKLINGYKNAMKDYKETGNEQCLQAAELIKKHLEKRGIKVDDI